MMSGGMPMTSEMPMGGTGLTSGMTSGMATTGAMGGSSLNKGALISGQGCTICQAEGLN